MPSCNTVTCTGFSANVLGSGLQQSNALAWWLKGSNGDYNALWSVFSEDSAHFGNMTWIGIGLKNGVGSATEVAGLRIFDCNNYLVGNPTALIIPTGMIWGKWVFTASFGQTCHWSLTPNSFGSGALPDAPPPV